MSHPALVSGPSPRRPGLAPHLAAALLLFSAGCSEGPRLFLQRTWPADQVALLIVTDAAGLPLEEAPRVLSPGASARFDLDAPGLVRLRVRTFPTHDAGGPDLDRCGVRFGGDGSLLPAPTSRWTTPLFDPQLTDALEPTEDTAGGEPELRFLRCFPTAYPCADVHLDLTTSEVLVDAPLYSIVAISDDLAYFSTFEDSSETLTTVGKIDHGVVSRLPASARVPGATGRLVWDGDHTLLATTSTGVLYSLDLDGTLGAVHTLSATVAGIARGVDGTLVAYGDFGVRELDPGTGALLDTPDLRFDLVTQQVALVRRDRGVALTEPEHLYGLAGGRWSHEYEPRASAFENWDGIGGDDDALAAVDRNGQVIVRRDATREWMKLPNPTTVTTAWRGVAGLGGGRLIVVGTSGSVALWTGESWCSYSDFGTHLGFHAVSVAPSRRVAYAVSTVREQGAGEPPVILRVALP